VKSNVFNTHGSVATLIAMELIHGADQRLG